MNVSGIYYIKNKKNNKIYIGSSKNIHVRIKNHFAQLRRGLHPNIHLRMAYKKYGEDVFETGILEECSLDKLLERENYYMNLYNSLDSKFGYNIAKIINTQNTFQQYKPKLFLSDERVKIIKLLICLRFEDNIIANNTNVPVSTVKGIRDGKIYRNKGDDHRFDMYSYCYEYKEPDDYDPIFLELKSLGYNTEWIDRYFNQMYNLTKFGIDYDLEMLT